ncbi:MAG TPA: flagellar assembly protein FliH [Burkholderiales bacterium]|nr:flagellar assembly protein FliH [Burkholderiales bacterium]
MAASPVIPKEKLSAYQRWELGSFDAPPARAGASAPDNTEQIATQAREEGYRVGHLEGLEAGRREALAQMAPRIARIDEMLALLNADLLRIDRELAADVFQLALVVARNLVGAVLEVRPEVVQTCVEEALRQMAHNYGPVHLTVNPQDAALVREVLKTSSRTPGWSLKEDAGISRGGCRVETAAGEIDATIEGRWQRTTAALGSPLDWVTPLQ